MILLWLFGVNVLHHKAPKKRFHIRDVFKPAQFSTIFVAISFALWFSRMVDDAVNSQFLWVIATIIQTPYSLDTYVQNCWWSTFKWASPQQTWELQQKLANADCLRELSGSGTRLRHVPNMTMAVFLNPQKPKDFERPAKRNHWKLSHFVTHSLDSLLQNWNSKHQDQN